ncbi:MAG: phosphoglycerate mutase family protein [Desulfobacterales bacterium]
MKKIYGYAIAICCIISVGVIFYFCCWYQITTVLLIRHAEAAGVPTNDPPLTTLGDTRAQRLAHVVANAGLDAIFVTNLQRTQQTAAYIAADLGLTPIIINETQIEELVTAIKTDHLGEKILVVNHSHTIPDIFEELNISEPPTVTSSDYDNLFVIHIRHWIFYRPRLTHLQYGEPTP